MDPRRQQKRPIRGGVGAVVFNNLVTGKSRAEAAKYFYEMMVLQSKGDVKLYQPEPYADCQVLDVRMG